MNIKREQYLNELIVCKHNTLIKIITGIRRCGKSYLLNTIFYDHLIKSGIKEDHIIKFAFDSANDLSLINEDLIELSLNNRKVDPKKFINYINRQIKDNQMYYLLLDEIQNLGAFESVLNGYLRQNNIDIYVTGSNAKFLSKDIITEFAGRGDGINMLPLSFCEFMSTYKGNKEQAFQEYITYGGLPFVCLLKTNEQKINYLKRLFLETYLTDIKKRYNIKNNSEELDELLNILSSSIGSLTNPTKLSNTFKSVKNKSISKTTIAKYIEYIKDSFLIDEVRQYDIKGKKYINSPKKYYFSDLGLRNARINFRQLEQTHSMENIIFNELKLRGFNVDIGIINQRVKNKNNQNIRQRLEVNFVANKGSNKIYIQSAFSIPNLEKEKQEQRPLIKINDSFKKVIITSGFVSKHYNEQGILIMNIYDFLLDPNSLN